MLERLEKKAEKGVSKSLKELNYAGADKVISNDDVENDDEEEESEGKITYFKI
jgi:hypothetical protein